MATNTPPNGAFRGFGAPQTLFAAELQMEKVAAALGMDARTLRQRNMVRRGSVLATGQTLKGQHRRADVLKICVARSDYRRKLREVRALESRAATNPTWKGIGMALVHHGAGFTGRGEVMLASRAAVSRSRATGRSRRWRRRRRWGRAPSRRSREIVADAPACRPPE